MEHCHDEWCHRYCNCYNSQAARLPGDTDMKDSPRNGGTFCSKYIDMKDPRAAILEAERCNSSVTARNRR